MQITDALTYALALAAACAATWGGARWWYGRKLRAALLRIDKLNQTRALCDQHTLQARRQIEQLNRELTHYRAREQWAPQAPEARPTVAPMPAAAAVAAPARPAPPAAEPRSATSDLARLLEAGDRWRTQQQQASAWQPTQQTHQDGWQATQQTQHDGWQPTQQIEERPAAAARGFADTLPM